MLRSIKHKQQWHAEWLSIWSVYFYFNTLTCQNYFCPEGMGGVHKTCGNSGGVGGGGVILCSKNGNSREEGGTCVKFPPWWGYGYFLELHNELFYGSVNTNLNLNFPCR